VNPIFWNVFFLKKSECQWGTSRYEQNIYQNQRRIEMGCGNKQPPVQRVVLMSPL